MRWGAVAMVAILAVPAMACGEDAGAGAAATTAAPASDPSITAAPTTTATTSVATTASTAAPPLTRPDWLGTRVLPRTPEGFGEVRPTPPELDPRRLPSIDVLAPPADGHFHSSIEAVPQVVAERSTWRPGCPVGLDDLRYVTVTFWGFDDRPHTGELLVHRDAAPSIVDVFARLFEVRFPIEEMRITTPAELDAPPTGDGNDTAAFVCRPTRGATSWSQHAYGLAVDVNPFQNPYVNDDVVLPELASSYVDRSDVRPGMLLPGGAPVAAFAAVGWEWGGAWERPTDHMHFSANGT